jgi:hypothetical protein
MRRSALRVFFERVIVASLPLAAPACSSAPSNPPPPPGDDMAMVVPADDLSMSTGDDLSQPPADLVTASNGDGPSVPHDLSCSPPVNANVPADKMPDMWPTLCIYGDPCTTYCPPTWTECCSPVPSDGGASLVHCVPPCSKLGRRPEGLQPAAPVGGCELGRYFAAMAHLEAASVPAFQRLARELREHGAPDELVWAARRSLREEARHARAARSMAREHGADAPEVRVAAAAKRSLEEIAIENAREGVVGETWGALVASWQARAAGDRRVRAMMAEIAGEEIGHAELAWAVDAWLSSKLDAAARERVRAAREQAVDELGAEIAQPLSAALVERLGLPDAERAQQFFASTRQSLWSRARLQS